ncbi:MAG: response regulator [bacterium]|nr:response regulator [bacterium]
MNRVVVVDDDETNLKFYSAVVKRVLAEEALAFENPCQALERLHDLRPSLIIVDYQMPEMDGVAFVNAVRGLPAHTYTPILMLTAAGDHALAERALAAGATLFLNKPLALGEFTKQLRHYAGTPAPRSSYGEIVMPTDERDTILRLHRTLEAFDRDLARQAAMVRDLTVATAEALHLPSEQVEALRIATLVYDIGMIAVPHKVRAMPSALTSRWRTVVNGHVDAGAAILTGGQRPLMRAAETIARLHHERYDGTGYPEGLSGDEIPLFARIVAVADTYAALVSERPHRVEFTDAHALAQVLGERGNAFDPAVVDAFVAGLERIDRSRSA